MIMCIFIYLSYWTYNVQCINLYVTQLPKKRFLKKKTEFKNDVFVEWTTIAVTWSSHHRGQIQCHLWRPITNVYNKLFREEMNKKHICNLIIPNHLFELNWIKNKIKRRETQRIFNKNSGKKLVESQWSSCYVNVQKKKKNSPLSSGWFV